MKLENQICSLELAKKLKTLGCKQESLFYWLKCRNGWKITEVILPDESFCSAFTVAELGEMLPSYNYYFAYSFKGSKEDEPWSCIWIFSQENLIKHQVQADTESDARAKMLIYLLENKLI